MECWPTLQPLDKWLYQADTRPWTGGQEEKQYTAMQWKIFWKAFCVVWKCTAVCYILNQCHLSTPFCTPLTAFINKKTWLEQRPWDVPGAWGIRLVWLIKLHSACWSSFCMCVYVNVCVSLYSHCAHTPTKQTQLIVLGLMSVNSSRELNAATVKEAWLVSRMVMF